MITSRKTTQMADQLPSSRNLLLDLAERTARLRLLDIDKALDAALVDMQREIAKRLSGEAPSLVRITADEDGGFIATGPNGAISQGATLEEALRNLADAVSISPPGG